MKTKPSLSFSLFHPGADLPCRLRLVVLLGTLSVAGRAIAADITDVFYGPGAGASTSSGQENTAIGFYSLYSNTAGYDNTAIGLYSLYSNTTGYDNTASGTQALDTNTTGYANTATGSGALYSNTTGYDNTATGYRALLSNSGGSGNVADGWEALFRNTSGIYNTASGAEALLSNTTGSSNTAVGAGALDRNLIGTQNSATGASALYYNTGNYNTATGTNALHQNTNGSQNTASGVSALYSNTGGSNVALGYQAGQNLTSGSNNIVIGAGLLGTAGESNTTRIGKSTQTKTLIGGIYGKTVASASGVPVVIDNTGKLGTVKSSARFKDNIKPMDKASEAVLELKPVTFNYKKELDPDGATQFGLIAEQVEKVDPHLVVRDEDGKLSTVRYEAVNAMLLNEFLKEHRKVQEQGATIAQMKRQLETLTATVQTVSNRIELSKPAPRMATND